jgi:glucokinase
LIIYIDPIPSLQFCRTITQNIVQIKNILSEGMEEVIGIDLGGTTIALGRFKRDGQCDRSLTIPTPQPATPEAVLDAIVSTIEELNCHKTCMAIGLGMPGPTDREGRIAKIAINLSGWRDVPLADWLEAKTGLATVLANDSNCAGLGEAWLGAGQNLQNWILLTLGTGVGGAVFLDGKLFTGHYGAAGELGLITLNPDGHPCNSGNSGSLEQHISVRAIRRITGKEPAEWGELAEAGNPEALAFWANYGRLLGAGIASLIYVLTPEAVVIGGGISAAARFFIPTARQEVERRVLFTSREGLQILNARLGNRAGMVGAARLVWQMLNHKTKGSAAV